MKSKLKKGDTVKILLGKDKSKEGKIEKILVSRGMVLVNGLNIVKKHVKPRGEGKPGGIVEINKPLLMSKVALICPKCHKPTRVGIRTGKGKDRLRVCKKCEQLI